MKNCFYGLPILVINLFACNDAQTSLPQESKEIISLASEKFVGDIPLPAGYKNLTDDGFSHFLQNLKLKSDKKVYLYNGMLKQNQNAQYAVLDISIGKKDLQQCADAVMRLRAEYLYGLKKYEAIEFTTGSGTVLNFQRWINGQRFKPAGNKLQPYYTTVSAANRELFDRYLEFVFSYCGTVSLPASLQSKKIEKIKAGDVFLKPGSPGHAVIVMAVARNNTGHTVYMLAQSYMPAQNIHILKNPADNHLSPWYFADEKKAIETPEWTFHPDQLYGWKKIHKKIQIRQKTCIFVTNDTK